MVETEQDGVIFSRDQSSNLRLRQFRFRFIESSGCEQPARLREQRRLKTGAEKGGKLNLKSSQKTRLTIDWKQRINVSFVSGGIQPYLKSKEAMLFQKTI
jgi:hypothetical protein